MTTQTPYGPASAENPQLAWGHAQYPPAEYQHMEYPQQAAPAYPSQDSPAYPQPSAPASAEQGAPAYSQQAAAGYPQQATPGYSQHATPGYQQATPGYQHAAPAYAQQATPSYQHAAPAYPRIDAAGYPQQATPAYPQPGAPLYPQEGATGYPEPVAYAEPTVPGEMEPAYPVADWYQEQQEATGVSAPDTTGFPGIQHPGESAYSDVAHEVERAPQQQAAYPPSAYPTAPPWAAPNAAPPAAPVAGEEADALVVTPYGVVPQVGGLLVPYPEEMRNAPRAQAPAVWPVAAFTFFFWVLGAISAARRSDHARRGRNSVAPYWVTYGIVLAVSAFFWGVMGLAVGKPLLESMRESATVAALEENVLHDGQLEKANISASSADCRAAGDWTGGRRDFLCELKLSDGRTGRVLVNADEQGSWRPLEDK
ncbi:chromosomal replication initiator protein DnaA [Couchioplanes caeruleus]|uniref:Uncharacterized protein n=2 Tax=Couchioplanes caeruleus TaxID=56438 RepID=A0A1K0H0V0_9ACTN|nr:hypothetical protein [Couchioplanes caeruleus]OJF15331.1 hypothetical protein BG844_05140 [Couchioplanes caeruleus subsp. caeruleus]ROP29468.1 hypothetical protein EDD30_2263 [Couchioplanes caeruleus]